MQRSENIGPIDICAVTVVGDGLLFYQFCVIELKAKKDKTKGAICRLLLAVHVVLTASLNDPLFLSATLFLSISDPLL